MVSVVVPVYNVEKYLKQCLDSINNQTYKDIEVIMVDDGSTDTSGKICDEYEKTHTNFCVIHKTNAGLGMARNTALEYISGEYVTFVDSDDYLETESIETLLKHMINNGVDMCKGGFKRVYNSGEIKSFRRYRNELFKGNDAKEVLFPRMIGSSPFQHDSIEMCVCGAIYNARIIKEKHLRFCSEREMISEDLVFNMEFMQHAKGACTIEDIGYNYRINIKSLTTSYRHDRFRSCKHFYLEMNKKLNQLGYDRNTILRLDRIFFLYIRGCIAQENKRRSGNSAKDCIDRISAICDDNVVQEVILNYPKEKLGLVQKIFLGLVRHKMSRMLHFLMEVGV